MRGGAGTQDCRDRRHLAHHRGREVLASGNARAAAIDDVLQDIGRRLQEDADANQQVNRWLRSLILYLVDTYREPLSAFISETINRWSADETSKKIELYVGSDLQFIRINGTLVGGQVGVVIYLLWGSIG